MSAMALRADAPAPGAATSREVVAFVETASGQRLRECYQCGKCAAGYPLGRAVDLLPQQIVRALQLGQADQAPFGMAISERRGDGQVEFAVQRIGVTDALHEMQKGDVVGVRGPMGKGFPLDELRGRRVVILGGGIGLAPLRPLVQEILDHRDEYGEMTIFCAGRSPDLLVFRDEYAEWADAPRTVVHVTVDKGGESWNGRVGLITHALAETAPSPQGAVAVTCGPPIMIRFVLQQLAKLGFAPEQVVTTLEGKMKCGLGKCGRCNVGDQYMCTDGPVFRYDQIQRFLEAF